MNTNEKHELSAFIRRICDQFHLTVVLIEHHVPLVLSVCDHVYVLNFGRLLAEGAPEAIRNHPDVVAAYLGGEAPEALEEAAT